MTTIYRLRVPIEGVEREVRLTKTGRLQFSRVNMAAERAYDAVAGKDGVYGAFLNEYNVMREHQKDFESGTLVSVHAGALALLLRSCCPAIPSNIAIKPFEAYEKTPAIEVRPVNGAPQISVYLPKDWWATTYQTGLARYWNERGGGGYEFILAHSPDEGAAIASSLWQVYPDGKMIFGSRFLQGREYAEFLAQRRPVG